MKVSIKTQVERDTKRPLWLITLTVKAGGKVKPAWTTRLQTTSIFEVGRVKREARVLDQSVRHQFRAARGSVKSAASLRRWWYAHIKPNE
jgi:hypothetical protein